MTLNRIGRGILVGGMLAAGVSLVMWRGLAAKSQPDPRAKEQSARNSGNPAIRPPLELPSVFDDDTAVRKALGKRVSLKLSGKTLGEALTEIAKTGDFNLYPDPEAIAAGDLDLKTKIADLEFRQAKLSTILDHVLRQHADVELAAMTRPGHVRIVTTDTAGAIRFTRFFSIRKIAGANDETYKQIKAALVELTVVENGDSTILDHPIVRIIKATTNGVWEEDDPDLGGSVQNLDGILVIRQTQRVLDEIAEIIQALEIASVGGLKGGSYRLPSWGVPDHAATAVALKALRQRISVEYETMSMKDVFADLEKRCGLTIHADPEAVMAGDLTLDTVINLKAKNLPAKTVLKLVLELHPDVEMRTQLEDGIISIITREKFDSIQSSVMYDIGDFIERGTDLERLTDVLRNFSEGIWEEDDPDLGGDLQKYRPAGVIVVRNTDEVHERIRLHLAKLRRRMKEHPDFIVKRAPPLDENQFVTRMYPFVFNERAEEVCSAITLFIARNSWADKKSVATISRVDGTLVIRQTLRVHRRIREFVKLLDRAELKQALGEDGPKKQNGGLGIF